MTLGSYPEVSLKEARDRRDQARRHLAKGIDPSVQRRIEKVVGSDDTFQAIALEWLERQRLRFAAATWVKAEWTFNDLIFPFIGSRPIREITAPEILAVCRRLEARGKHETAHRTKQRCGQVFRYAIATGRAERDLSQDLRGALTPLVEQHHAAPTDPREIGRCCVRCTPTRVFRRPRSP